MGNGGCCQVGAAEVADYALPAASYERLAKTSIAMNEIPHVLSGICHKDITRCRDELAQGDLYGGIIRRNAQCQAKDGAYEIQQADKYILIENYVNY